MKYSTDAIKESFKEAMAQLSIISASQVVQVCNVTSQMDHTVVGAAAEPFFFYCIKLENAKHN